MVYKVSGVQDAVAKAPQAHASDVADPDGHVSRAVGVACVPDGHVFAADQT